MTAHSLRITRPSAFPRMPLSIRAKILLAFFLIITLMGTVNASMIWRRTSAN